MKQRETKNALATLKKKQKKINLRIVMSTKKTIC